MTAESINQVAVVGLGTMGHAIAQVFAAAGCTVRCWDSAEPMRGSLLDRVRANLADMIAAGLGDEASARETISRIRVCDAEAEAAHGAQFVTEAVREDLVSKQELFERLEAEASPETILASNSSTFPVSQSAARMKKPDRAVVTHWFNPPHIVPTVEVVPGPRTSERTAAVTVALMKRIGKSAVRINRELPGFLVNRVQIAMIREVWDLLDKGVASPEDIDAAIRGSLGFRLAALGPLEVCDFGGLDIWTRVYDNLVRDIRSDQDLPDAVRDLVESGRFGAKTGGGVYDYGPGVVDRKRTRRDRRFLALAKLFYDRSRPEPAPDPDSGPAPGADSD